MLALVMAGDIDDLARRATRSIQDLRADWHGSHVNLADDAMVVEARTDPGDASSLCCNEAVTIEPADTREADARGLLDEHAREMACRYPDASWAGVDGRKDVRG